MNVAKKIQSKLERILKRLKVLHVVETFSLEISFCQIEENLKSSLIEIDSILKKCLRKIITKPRKAEIRNIICEIVKKKNLSDGFESESRVEASNNCMGLSDDFVNLLKSQNHEVEFKCDVCSLGFESTRHLIIHKKIHNKLKNLLCEFCGNIFNEILKCKCESETTRGGIFRYDKNINSDYFEAVDTRHDEIDSNNILENNEFVIFKDVSLPKKPLLESQTDGLMKNELKNEVPSVQKSEYTCHCGKVFHLLKTLKKHERVKHSSENVSHNCMICQRPFREKGKLNRHMLSHKIRQHQCSFCLKFFTRSDALRRHSSTAHYLEKNFSCTFCHKKFSLKYNKDVHEENIHKRINSWIQCEKCDKKFRNKITFKSHLKIHSEKQIICNICYKCFTRNSCYKNHIKNKHTEVPFQQSTAYS